MTSPWAVNAVDSITVPNPPVPGQPYITIDDGVIRIFDASGFEVITIDGTSGFVTRSFDGSRVVVQDNAGSQALIALYHDAIVGYVQDPALMYVNHLGTTPGVDIKPGFIINGPKPDVWLHDVPGLSFYVDEGGPPWAITQMNASIHCFSGQFNLGTWNQTTGVLIGEPAYLQVYSESASLGAASQALTITDTLLGGCTLTPDLTNITGQTFKFEATCVYDFSCAVLSAGVSQNGRLELNGAPVAGEPAIAVHTAAGARFTVTQTFKGTTADATPVFEMVASKSANLGTYNAARSTTLHLAMYAAGSP